MESVQSGTERDQTTIHLTDLDNASHKRESAARYVGIDVARGCAVLGMFATHLGPQDPQNWLYQLFNGRAAGLFAVLAGVSVSLITGGARPRSGIELTHRRWQLAVRAVLLFLLGLGLTALGTTVKEILTVYAVLFLVAIPLVRLRPVALVCCAAGTAVAGPLLSYLLRSTVLAGYRPGLTPQLTAFGSVHGWAQCLESLLVTGPYPVLTWVPFLFCGMAVGRLDLTRATTQARLLLGGALLAAATYVLSWVCMNQLGGWRAVAEAVHVSPGQAHAVAASGVGAVSTASPLLLLDTTGHSGSPLEIVAVIGCAVAVIGACLVLASWWGRALTPLAGVGALPLTAYAGHIVLIAFLQAGALPSMGQAILAGSYIPLLVTVAVTLVALTLQRATLGRGPLEFVMHAVSTTVARAIIASWQRMRPAQENRVQKNRAQENG